MDYTKDMVLEVHYDKAHTINGKRTSRILQTIRRHKIITMAIFSAIIFVSIDVVLITNFFHILTMI